MVHPEGATLTVRLAKVVVLGEILYQLIETFTESTHVLTQLIHLRLQQVIRLGRPRAWLPFWSQYLLTFEPAYADSKYHQIR